MRTRQHEGKHTTCTVADPLDFLREKLGKHTVASLPDLPPFVGGAIGYAGYDVVRYVEKLPNAPTDDRSLPDLDFGFYDLLVVFDNANKTVMILNLVYRPSDVDQAYKTAVDRIQSVVDRLSGALTPLPAADIVLGAQPTIQARSNFTQAEFEKAVAKCREYIKAGDAFQVCPLYTFYAADE